MFKWFLPTVIAMLFGLIVLVGTLLPSIAPLQQLRQLFVYWVTIVGAFALFLAYLSLIRVHLTRLARVKKHKLASFLVVISAFGSLVVVLLPIFLKEPWAELLPQLLLKHILVPGESALLILTAITLVLTGMRALRTRRTFGSIVFALVAVFMLVASVPYLGILDEIARRYINPAAMAGMRGVLIGSALGVTLTGLRVILGIDRPHSEG